jgi:hypothetical protein
VFVCLHLAAVSLDVLHRVAWGLRTA